MSWIVWLLVSTCSSERTRGTEDPNGPMPWDLPLLFLFPAFLYQKKEERGMRPKACRTVEATGKPIRNEGFHGPGFDVQGVCAECLC